jgi:retron-type reverse transcriptase
VDGETWRSYGRDLEERLKDLSGRLQRGAYRPQPVKRVYIPKAEGRQRPIGITALEDKIVERATVEVLNAVYETIPGKCHLPPKLVGTSNKNAQ